MAGRLHELGVVRDAPPKAARRATHPSANRVGKPAASGPATIPDAHRRLDNASGAVVALDCVGHGHRQQGRPCFGGAGEYGVDQPGVRHGRAASWTATKSASIVVNASGIGDRLEALGSAVGYLDRARRRGGGTSRSSGGITTMHWHTSDRE